MSYVIKGWNDYDVQIEADRVELRKRGETESGTISYCNHKKDRLSMK